MSPPRSTYLVHLGDAELVARCRQGDQAAWDVFVERFGNYVYAIAKGRYRLERAEADEVFQEVFARSFQQLNRLRDDAAVRGWIGQMTARLAIDRLRARRREELTDEIPEPGGDSGMELLDEAMDVRSALVHLPEHCQEIIDRFFARDQSYDTIGGALGIPPGTIASRISRCLGKLRERLTTAEARA